MMYMYIYYYKGSSYSLTIFQQKAFICFGNQNDDLF